MSTYRDKRIPAGDISSDLVHPKYRPDIDGLRAVAVLSVVAYHAFPGSLSGGFVGVDVFFVISGFLISTIIIGSLEKGTFSFLDFYRRRIRRIFPALLVVLAFCAALGWFALLADEYEQLGKHIAAGAGFVSNFVLWSEVDYFDTAAETKPLLHLWSLGIEEQFYIVWPVILWVAWTRKVNLLAVLVVATLVSFAFNLFLYRVDGTADFYSPQSRFWELFVGALLAYTHTGVPALARAAAAADAWLKRLAPALIRRNGFPDLADAKAAAGAILVVLSLTVISSDDAFPGILAVLPVVGTAMIISAGMRPWLNRVLLSNRAMVWFGKISFPLYLWHWPLLSFARIAESEEPSPLFRAGAVLCAIVLAGLTYAFVERSFRFGTHGKFKAAALLTAMVIAAGAGYGIYQKDGLPSRASIMELETALSLTKWRDEDNADPICRGRMGKQFAYCRLAIDADPTVALIGDSFANSYFPGLAAEYAAVGENLVMVGAGGCPPLLNITSGFAGEPDWCHSMGTNAIKAIADLQTVHTVILAANWHLYINGTRFYQRYDKPWEIRSTDRQEASNAEVFTRTIRETIDLLRASGKTVVAMKQTPELDLDPTRCLIDRPLAFTMKERKCEMTEGAVRAYLAEYEEVFDAAVAPGDRVKIVDPLSALCSDGVCEVMDGVYPLYRDTLHLSSHGSKYVAHRLGLF